MKLTSFIKNESWEDWYVISATGKQYLITIDLIEKTVYCTCPDFKYRKDNLKFGGALLTDKENHCKHIEYILRIRRVLDG